MYIVVISPLYGLRRHHKCHEVTSLDFIGGHQVSSNVERTQHNAVQGYIGEGLEGADSDPQHLVEVRRLLQLTVIKSAKLTPHCKVDV